MKIQFFWLCSLVFLLSGCQNLKQPELVITEIADLGNHSFRGLSIVDSNTVWVSGSDGGVFVSQETTKKWAWRFDTFHYNGSSKWQFRDIEGFDGFEAVAMTAGFPGLIVKTINGGQSWTTCYENLDSNVFIDALAFWDKQRGIAFGDPLDGYHFVLLTNDGGNTWQRIPENSLPQALTPEAGFAASGTSVVVQPNGFAWIGTGGQKSRVIMTTDFGSNWNVVETPMKHNHAASGIYALAFKDNKYGVAVGGRYDQPDDSMSTDSTSDTHIYTQDGGLSWSKSTGHSAYRSGVCHAKGHIFIATGTSGTDISYDNGQSWSKVNTIGMNAIQFTPNSEVGYGVGSNGKIYQLSWK